LNFLQVIAFTHRHFNFDEIGYFHLEDNNRIIELKKLKSILEVDELMYLSTCNRVEFIIKSNTLDTKKATFKLIDFFSKKTKTNLNEKFKNKVEVFTSDEAVKHLFCVASSIDSLVVGEREIITQFRKAFEECKDHNLCGDFIRVLVQMTIQTAKKIFTESNIATRPVSVVSLAFMELNKYIGNKTRNFLIIGAGKTIASMLKFTSKNSTHHYTIYNRSTQKASLLSKQLNLNAKVFPIDELGSRKENFDFIITCTASKHVVLDLIKFNNLNDSNRKKTIVDLAVPKDCSKDVSELDYIRMISVEELKIIAEENLKARKKEVDECLKIIDDQIKEYNITEKERELERKMSVVPQRIKGIREKAFAEIFVKEIKNLDPEARLILDTLVDYMEKKYISVPMKMAKEILLKESIKQ
tara:strand:+ start:2470 stop:3708 length:1239 start_codon:yes stop_codon:yes gene_type:complete